MPSLVPIVRCREIPTNSKMENRSIARFELVYRSTLTYVAARFHSFNDRSRPEERHYERFSVRSTFATNRYTGLYMYVLRVLCISCAPKHPKCPSRNSFVRLDDRKKSTSYEFLFPLFFLFRVSFFFFFFFRKIVSTMALDVRTRRKYRCEYAGDRGTILINQIYEKTIILI